MKFDLPKIYPITDRRISGLSHIEQVRRLAAGGAKLIQLRDKTSGAREFFDAAVEVMTFAREAGITILINDRVDIALSARAHGVHLGQDDMPPDQARKLLGQDAIIGFSTHSVDQAISAAELPVTYIAIGPIFSTSTKEDPDPVVGIEGLRAVRRAIGDKWLVAIGGIDRANAPDVLRAGADSVALISDLLSDPQAISSRMQELTAKT